MLKLALFLLVFFQGAMAILALDPSTPLTSYGHRAWQSEDGLPQNSILTILQTSDGYLWMGTQGGLARFDGVSFTVFEARNSALGNNDVVGLLEDRNGRLWIATYGAGLSYYEKGELRRYEHNDQLSDLTVRCILLDRRGTLWVGTRYGGMNRIDAGRVEKARDITAVTIQSMAEDSEGNIWIGTDSGLFCYAGGIVKAFTKENGLPHNSVRYVFADRKGSVWIGTDEGLARWNRSSFRTFTTADGLANNFVRAVLEDHNGNLWAGTDHGLSRLRGETFEALQDLTLLSHNSINSLFEDREGTLWIGTDGGGLNQFRNISFSNIESRNPRGDSTVFSVLQDADGSLWTGTRTSGLIHHTSGGPKHYTTREGLLSDTVYALHRDRSGLLWIGTRGNGINLLGPAGKLTTLTKDHGLTGGAIRDIREDGAGSVWIGTSNGLNRYQDGKLTVYTTREGLSHNFIYCMLQDRRGRLWVGTWAGLTMLENGKFTTLTSRNGFTDSNVWCLFEDRNGTLWIGTYGSGLFRYQDGRLKNFTSKDGLFEDTLLGIAGDDFGNLWISTYRGIFRIAIAALEAFASGRAQTIAQEIFDSSDGMKSVECIGGVQPSVWKGLGGRLYFPTGKGLTSIDPGKIQRNALAPPVLIQRLVYDSAASIIPSRLTETPAFPPGEGNLEIHYAGLSYVDPQKNRFQYRLEGFDRDWIDAATRRTAYYTKIPPGEYTFRVRASNNDGVWNDTGASLAFLILPHFYQTRWFYAICLAALVVAGVATHRLRIRRIRSRFAAVLEERARISREIHDTLTQDFTGVVLQLEAAEVSLPDQLDQVRDCLRRARDLARTGLVESRRFVKGLRPVELQSNDLSAGLLQAVSRAVRDTRITSDVQIHGKKLALPAAMEDNILRIAQEAITNSVKHSGGGSINVVLTYTRRTVELEVTDDGSGFEASAQQHNGESGFGLTGMRERAALLRAELLLGRSGSGGARISLRVPIPGKG